MRRAWESAVYDNHDLAAIYGRGIAGMIYKLRNFSAAELQYYYQRCPPAERALLRSMDRNLREAAASGGTLFVPGVRSARVLYDDQYRGPGMPRTDSAPPTVREGARIRVTGRRYRGRTGVVTHVTEGGITADLGLPNGYRPVLLAGEYRVEAAPRRNRYGIGDYVELREPVGGYQYGQVRGFALAQGSHLMPGGLPAAGSKVTGVKLRLGRTPGAIRSGAPEGQTPHTNIVRRVDLDGRPYYAEAARGERITPETAARMRAGDIVVDGDGNEYRAHAARHHWLLVHPIVGGRPQVSADTGIRFLLSPDRAAAYPEMRPDPIYATGRNLHDGPGTARTEAGDGEYWITDGNGYPYRGPFPTARAALDHYDAEIVPNTAPGGRWDFYVGRGTGPTGSGDTSGGYSDGYFSQLYDRDDVEGGVVESRRPRAEARPPRGSVSLATARARDKVRQQPRQAYWMTDEDGNPYNGPFDTARAALDYYDRKVVPSTAAHSRSEFYVGYGDPSGPGHFSQLYDRDDVEGGVVESRRPRALRESHETSAAVQDAPTGRQRTLVQYSDCGNVLSATTRSRPRLEAGVYAVRSNMEGVYYEKVDQNSDAILKFEDARLDAIHEEVNSFWDLAEAFHEMGITHKRGLLLHGAPGMGKSVLLRQLSEYAVAHDNVVFVGSRDMGTTVRGLKEFKEVEPDRRCLVVMEDMDEICRYDEHSVLEMMDGGDQMDGVLIVGTTNYLDRLPPRILRAGRFDTKVEVLALPPQGRRAYFQHKLGKIESAERIEEIVALTDGFSFAQMREMIASVYCYRRPLEASIDRIRRNFTESARLLTRSLTEAPSRSPSGYRSIRVTTRDYGVRSQLGDWYSISYDGLTAAEMSEFWQEELGGLSGMDLLLGFIGAGLHSVRQGQSELYYQDRPVQARDVEQTTGDPARPEYVLVVNGEEVLLQDLLPAAGRTESRARRELTEAQLNVLLADALERVEDDLWIVRAGTREVLDGPFENRRAAEAALGEVKPGVDASIVSGYYLGHRTTEVRRRSEPSS